MERIEVIKHLTRMSMEAAKTSDRQALASAVQMLKDGEVEKKNEVKQPKNNQKTTEK